MILLAPVNQSSEKILILGPGGILILAGATLLKTPNLGRRILNLVGAATWENSDPGVSY